MDELAAFLDEHYEKGVVSNRVLAAELDVSEGAVRKRLRGEDNPSPDHATHVREWMDRIIKGKRRP